MTKSISIPITFILEKDKESGWYSSQIKEFPQAISQGKTKKEAIDNVMEAFGEFMLLYQETKKRQIRKSPNRIIEKATILLHA